MSVRRPMIEVRHSPIHGYGVFALRRIRKGTTVIEYLGERVSHAQADERYEDKGPGDNHTFLFTVDSRTVIDAGVGGNEARFINHACDPNCQSTTRKRRIFIETIRTIRPGEELSYDYQIQRDPDDPPDVDEVFACRCGAHSCRGSMLEAPPRPRRKPRGSPRRKPLPRTATGREAKGLGAKRVPATRRQAKRVPAARRQATGSPATRRVAKRSPTTRRPTKRSSARRRPAGR